MGSSSFGSDSADSENCDGEPPPWEDRTADDFGGIFFDSKMATEKLTATGKASIAPKIAPQAVQITRAKNPNQKRLRRKAITKGTRPNNMPDIRPPTIKGNR